MTDQTMPDGAWKFDANVTEVFEDMLQRSIPQYEVMRKTCVEIAARFWKKGTDILDLGASKGDSIEPLVDKFGAYNRFVLVECSAPMIEALQSKFSGYLNTNIVQIKNIDLRKEFPSVQCCIVQSVLTIQFIPIEYRQQIIQSVYDALIPGGAFIFVEKVLGNSAAINEMIVDLYYGVKRQNGYTNDQIERKKLSLEGVLVPVTAGWNEELLRQAGFRQVDCFWRYLNFAGWVAVK